MTDPYLELTLRDELALQRTTLANRRTWLAAARTGIALFVAGASFLQFFERPLLEAVGVFSMVLAGPVAWFGYRRFQRLQARLHAMGGDPNI